MGKNKTKNCFLLGIDEFFSELNKEKEHTLYVIERKGSLTITIQPLDPSELAIDVLSRVHSAVLMSGTLLPLQMYSDILGLTQIKDNEIIENKIMQTKNDSSQIPLNAPQSTTAFELLKTQKSQAPQSQNGGFENQINNSKIIMKEYKSPFPKENRLNLIVNKTTTKYTSRSAAQYEDIAQEIDKIVSKVPGNTIVFFPSFELMYSISSMLKTKRQVLRQEKEMTQDEKTKLIHNFKILGSGFGGVLLAVSGGSIAEGIDFPGDHLSCAIIVGVPFAKMNIYSNALINYYEQKFHKGWDYAYNAPAIGKAMQAAGRVIRTETDRGACIFLDERFAEERYKRFYSKDFTSKTTNNPQKEVEEFFGK